MTIPFSSGCSELGLFEPSHYLKDMLLFQWFLVRSLFAHFVWIDTYSS